MDLLDRGGVAHPQRLRPLIPCRRMDLVFDNGVECEIIKPFGMRAAKITIAGRLLLILRETTVRFCEHSGLSSTHGLIVDRIRRRDTYLKLTTV